MPSPQPFRIPAQRVPLLVPDQDIMSREWYRFFNRKPRHGAFFDTTTQTAASSNTAYIYARDEATGAWGTAAVAPLTGYTSQGDFGRGVSIHGSYALVGAETAKTAYFFSLACPLGAYREGGSCISCAAGSYGGGG